MSVPALPLGGCLFHHGGERDHDMFSLGTSILASIMFPSRTVILCQIVPPEINAKEKFLSATAHRVVETMDCLPVPGCPRDLDGPTKSSWTAIDWRPCGRELLMVTRLADSGSLMVIVHSRHLPSPTLC
jgi:hypothetical protein